MFFIGLRKPVIPRQQWTTSLDTHHTTFDLIEWEIHQVFGIGNFSAAGLEAAVARR